MCGAPAASDAANCGHCGARLATIACPSCFGLVFQGSRFCAHCGGRVTRRVGPAAGIVCAVCDTQMMEVTLGATTVAECPKCDGLWLEQKKFAQICEEREHHTTILGMSANIPEAELPKSFRYVRCPICAEFMLRVNFATYSGVVIDVCQAHGIWFEKNELQRIINFIRAGGLDVARKRKIAEIQSATRHLESLKADEVERARREPRRDTSSDGALLGLAIEGVIDSITDSMLGLD